MEEKNDTQLLTRHKPGRPKKEKTNVEPEPIKIRGRPKKYEEGCHQFMKNSHYSNNYYHKTNKQINCPICYKASTSRTLIQHQKSALCKLIKSNI